MVLLIHRNPSVTHLYKVGRVEIVAEAVAKVVDLAPHVLTGNLREVQIVPARRLETYR